jgi:magnesium transporter
MGKSQLTTLVQDVTKPVKTIVHDNETIEESLKKLRQKEIDHKIVYFYVVDSEDKLVGMVSTRKLLLSNPSLLINEIMDRSVISLKEGQTLQDAMEIFASRSLLALPVLDADNHIIGIIDVEMYLEENFDIADAKHRTDIFQMIGITLEDEKKASLWRSYRLRMPWLFCNIIGGILCAIISEMHEVVLSKIIMLAMFIPLVLALSESVSMQSMAHCLQLLRSPINKKKVLFFKAFKDWKTVIVMSLTCGLLVGGVSLLWKDGIMPSITIGLGIFISVIISAGFGIIFPILLHKARLDPKVASGPVVLMFADVLTTTLYLSLASWWLI